MLDSSVEEQKVVSKSMPVDFKRMTNSIGVYVERRPVNSIG